TAGRGASGPRLSFVLISQEQELASIEDRVRLAGDVDDDRFVGDLEDFAEDDIACVDRRALALRPVLALWLALSLARTATRIVLLGVQPFGARFRGAFGLRVLAHLLRV